MTDGLVIDDLIVRVLEGVAGIANKASSKTARRRRTGRPWGMQNSRWIIAGAAVVATLVVVVALPVVPRDRSNA